MCSVYFDILILKLMCYSTALLSTPKGRIIREWGKFCNFVVVCLGGRVNMLDDRFALGGLVGSRQLSICSKKWVGLVPRERKREFSSNHQQLFVANEKVPSCMWQSSQLSCWIAPLIWQLAVRHWTTRNSLCLIQT